MSVHATTWAWKQRTASSGQRLVLLALCDHMAEHEDVDGYTAWPSVRRLCEMTLLSNSTVRTHLSGLVDLGLVEKVERRRRGSGTLSTWLYRIPTSDVVQRQSVASSADTQAVESADVSAVSSADTSARGNIIEKHNCETLEQSARVDDVEAATESERPGWERARQLTHTFADCVEQTGSRRPSVSQSEIREMERMIRLDGRSDEQIEAVIRWLFASPDEIASFWRPNVRSVRKLRSRWDQIAAQVKRSRERTRAGSGASSLDRIRAANMTHTHEGTH